MRALCRASHAQGHLPCLRQSDDNVRALNDFDLLQYYYPVAFEFTYEELVARRANSFASSRRNMSYYAASQAMNIKGRANQVAWHPGIKTFFTGAHQDPLDEAGKEIPQDMSAAMIEAWTSEPVPDQAVLIKFCARSFLSFAPHSGPIPAELCSSRVMSVGKVLLGDGGTPRGLQDYRTTCYLFDYLDFLSASKEPAPQSRSRAPK